MVIDPSRLPTKGLLRSLLCLAAVLFTATAHAQTYRCSAGGSVYFSDRPCGTAGQGTRLGGYGPLRPAPTTPHAMQLPRAPKAENHVKYLGTECASISEGIRTGPARGVKHDVIQDLYHEYRQKCTAEDQEARRQLQLDASQEQAQKQSQRDAALNGRVLAQQQSDRCIAMRDVISVKRSREATLNEKEVQVLRSLETTYNTQCLVR